MTSIQTLEYVDYEELRAEVEDHARDYNMTYPIVAVTTIHAQEQIVKAAALTLVGLDVRVEGDYLRITMNTDDQALAYADFAEATDETAGSFTL
jgi:hypothetical protein